MQGVSQVHTCQVRGRTVLGLFGWLRLIADAGHGPVDVDYDVEDDLVIGARVRVVLADGGLRARALAVDLHRQAGLVRARRLDVEVRSPAALAGGLHQRPRRHAVASATRSKAAMKSMFICAE